MRLRTARARGGVCRRMEMSQSESSSIIRAVLRSDARNLWYRSSVTVGSFGMGWDERFQYMDVSKPGHCVSNSWSLIGAALL